VGAAIPTSLEQKAGSFGSISPRISVLLFYHIGRLLDLIASHIAQRYEKEEQFISFLTELYFGTITIGETAVFAKIIHPLTRIVVGVNFLTSMHIASGGLWESLVLLHIVFILVGNFFGVTGILIGFLSLIA
jgi:hypothetical protein